MSEEQGHYQTTKGGTVVSDAQAAISELSAYYAQVPEDLLASGKPAAVVVYGMLDRIAHEGTGWASIEAIAERTHLSVRTVQTARAWLIENGWLVVLHQGRSGRATDYQLPWRSSRQHATLTPSTCKNDTLQDAKLAHHPEPSPEPKTEPYLIYRSATQDFSKGFQILTEVGAVTESERGYALAMWLRENEVTPEIFHAAAVALVGEWGMNSKRQYRDPYRAVRNWALNKKQWDSQQTAPRNGQNGKSKPDIDPYVKAVEDQRKRRISLGLDPDPLKGPVPYMPGSEVGKASGSPGTP